MKTLKTHIQNWSIALALLALSQFSTAQAQGTAFLYQGQLVVGGNPANGNYDLAFSLIDASAGGSPIIGPITNSATAVTNGFFTVTLDFGEGIFTGPSHWLDVSVRPTGSNTFSE